MRFLLILLVVAVGVLAWAWWARPDVAGSSWDVSRPPTEKALERLGAAVSEPARFLGVDLVGGASRKTVRAALARVVITGRVLPVLALV
ncbi:MAG TPA: hypothetical protein VK661_12080, partial [Planctomycetota bacterium]|nr:hypothetical protein [Planctomycetota bacterium]